MWYSTNILQDSYSRRRSGNGIKNNLKFQKPCGIITVSYTHLDVYKRQAVTNAGADFIKTSTGFGTAGATMEDVLLMKEHIGAEVKIKAAGGIRTKEDMENYIKAGCSRLGTSSAVDILGQQILRAMKNDKIMKKICKTEIIQKR